MVRRAVVVVVALAVGFGAGWATYAVSHDEVPKALFCNRAPEPGPEVNEWMRYC